MKAKIINSGSDGNCTVLTDSIGNQIMLDCGLPYKVIVPNINMARLDALFITHAHHDHCYDSSYTKFKNYGVDIYTQDTTTVNQVISLKNWFILPLPLQHNVKCHGYLVRSKIDNKTVAYITDTIYIPNLNLDNIDLLIIETNYDTNVVQECEAKGTSVNSGYRNHLSIQQVEGYLQSHNANLKSIVAYHISNSGLIKIPKIIQTLSKYAQKVYISEPNAEIVV